MGILAGINPVAFSIGSIEVRWYGIVIVCGMLLGLLYACSQIKKINLTSDDAIELFLWMIPLAVIFCRILYVFPGRIDEYFPWESGDDFVRAIAIWDGGITIIGGIIGGCIGVMIFSFRHRKQTNFGNVADLVIVPVLTGQIIGRLGNFFNQEAFGLPITDPKLQCFPFGVYIDSPSGVEPAFRDKVYSHIAEGGGGNWFCATFFYEEVWNFIGMVICLFMWKKGYYKKYPGILMIFYFFWYCLGRFWLEFLRMDAVPVTKVACIVVAPIALVFGVFYILYRNSKVSYDRMNALALSGKLSETAITSYDVKNHAFVTKIRKSEKNVLKVLYGKSDITEIDFEKSGCYVASENYRKKFSSSVKNDEYSKEV
ncbi:MAG: prolipoprotein diacylglyceryl transferase [Clostridia bacterium]|nr:prolipoprotein diacylglyceryl transferase [Clostridia bacterium]